MKLNLTSIAGALLSVVGSAQVALQLLETTVDLIESVEEMLDGLKGKDKLAAVKAGAKTAAETLGIDDDFDRIWKKLGPIVSMIVTIANLKDLWPKKEAPKAPQAPNPAASQPIGLSGGVTHAAQTTRALGT